MKHSHCETVYIKELFQWLFFEWVHSLRILSILPTFKLATECQWLSNSNSNWNQLYCHIHDTQYNFKKRQATNNRLKYKYFPTSSNTYNMAKGAGNPRGFMGPLSVIKYRTCILTGCSVHLVQKTKCADHHWQCNIIPRRQFVDILYIKDATEIENFWWL